MFILYCLQSELYQKSHLFYKIDIFFNKEQAVKLTANDVVLYFKLLNGKVKIVNIKIDIHFVNSNVESAY